MARMWSCGFELNSATSGVEFSTVIGTPTIVTSPVRSGTYAMNATGSGGVNNDARIVLAAANANGPYYTRIYLYIDTLPNAICSVIGYMNSAGSARSRIRLATDGTLELWDSAGKIGSSSSALSLDTWYRLELSFFNNTTSARLETEAKLDDTTFASTTTSTNTGGIDKIFTGNGTAVATIDITLDDWAVNDDTGSAQTSWPGEGKIAAYIRPNGAGDDSDWTNDYQNVDEITPDDATTLCNAGTTIGNKDEHACQSSSDVGIGSSDTITLVQVGGRFNRAGGAGTNGDFRYRLKSASGGTTVTSSSTPTASSATWRTNQNSDTLKAYILTSYTDPTTTVAWTPTGTNSIDNMQIGYELMSAPSSGREPQMTAVWALVEYVPAAGGTAVKDIIGGGIIPFAR
jgi:hypothetical protein